MHIRITSLLFWNNYQPHLQEKVISFTSSRTPWGTSCNRTWLAEADRPIMQRKVSLLCWRSCSEQNGSPGFTWLIRNQTALVFWVERLLSWNYCYILENILLKKKQARKKGSQRKPSVHSPVHRSRPQRSQRAKIRLFISMAPLVLKTNLQQSYSLLNSSGDLLQTVCTAIQVSNRVAIVSSSSSLT